MATGFTKYWAKSEKHGVAEVSDMLATTAGHIENVRVAEDIDNGSFVSLDTFEAGDVWKAKKPATAEAIYLIASSEDIHEDFSPKARAVENFYNEKGDVARAYQLFARDKFALSKEAFADGASPAVGKYLDFSKGYKAAIAAEAPAAGPVAKIYDVAPTGVFRVVVEKII